MLIGASTGAPRTHHRYLGEVPRSLAASIVIVQHMPAGPFIEGVLRHLRRSVAVPVKLAENGDTLQPGRVLIAVPGSQLRFDRLARTARVARSRGENYFSPSINVTFSSAAAVFGSRCCAVMTSGLHADHDGLAGCRAVRAAGGQVIVTTPETTPCYRMVHQLRQEGAFDTEAPLPRILQVAARWLRS